MHNPFVSLKNDAHHVRWIMMAELFHNEPALIAPRKKCTALLTIKSTTRDDVSARRTA